jgi:hypothetical protein
MGSVWHREINKALISTLTGIQCINTLGVKTNVPIIPRYPEKEYKIETFPSITFAPMDERFMSKLFSEQLRYVSSVDANNMGTYEQQIKPYRFQYQIDLWSNFQSDMDDMTMQFNDLIGEHSILPTISNTGETYSSPIDRIGGNTRLEEHIEDTTNQRIFHTIYIYNIQGYIDEKLADIIRVVTEVVTKNTN